MIYFTKCLPQYFQYLPGTIHSYYNITDYIPYLCFTFPWLFCNCQSVFLIPSTFHPVSQHTYPLNPQTLFCIYQPLSVLFIHLYCSLDCTYNELFRFNSKKDATPIEDMWIASIDIKMFNIISH